MLDLLGLSVEAIESKIPMCPITDLLEVLSAKWTIEILRELAIGEPARTRRFLEHVPNLSMKSLRQRLIVLEQQGFIQRQVFEQRAPRVEYSLTAKGRKLEELAAIIKTYADEFAGQACCSCPMEKTCDSTNFVCPGRKAGRNRE